jgi:hypothetical protein
MQTSLPLLPRASAAPKFGRLQLNFRPIPEGNEPPPFNPANYPENMRTNMAQIHKEWEGLFIPKITARVMPEPSDSVEFTELDGTGAIRGDEAIEDLKATIFSPGWRPIPGSSETADALIGLGEDEDFVQWRDAHVPGRLEHFSPKGINPYKTVGDQRLSREGQVHVAQMEQKLPSVSFYYQLNQRLKNVLNPQQREAFQPLLPLLYGVADKIKASTGRVYPLHDYLTQAFQKALPNVVPRNKVGQVNDAVQAAEQEVEKNLRSFEKEVKNNLPEVLSELTADSLLQDGSRNPRSFEDLRDKVSRDQFSVMVQQSWQGDGIGFADVLRSNQEELERFRAG